MNKEVLVELIEEMEAFEAENQHLTDYGLVDFLSFMQIKSSNTGESFVFRKDGGEKRPEGFAFDGNTSVIISRLISLLYRYAKEYTKKALEESKLQTVEEFSFLIVLLTYDNLSKTELIRKNVMNKTSGTEVIKRLLKKGLIHQFRDKKDRRSQLVAITPTGLSEMRKVFPKMKTASEIISGNLDLNEQHTLVFILKKLESYHHQKFTG